MAVPIVMFTMLITLALASAAVVASSVSHGGTVRDQSSKSALAAAEAGVNQAFLHYNRISAVAPDACLWGEHGAPVSPEPPVGGWCRAVSGNVTGLPQSTFSYSVRPCARPKPAEPCPAVPTGKQASILEVVSTGTVAGVSRRVDVVGHSAVGLQPFISSASIVGLDSIGVENGGGGITGDVASNGNINLGTGAQLNCGSATVAAGHQIYPPAQMDPNCQTIVGETELPPVNQADAATNNVNHYFFSTDPITPSCPSTCWVDTGTPPNTTRQLTVRTNRTLSLKGPTYSLCKLVLESNANLYVKAGAVVQIYFDDPKHCPGLTKESDGTYHQLVMHSNARMTVSGASPGHLALLFVGSTDPEWPTSIFFSSNTVPNQECVQDFVVYAPLSAINIASNSNFCGAMIGKSVLVSSNASVQASNVASQYQLPDTVAAHYDASSFVECSPSASAAAPNSGC